MPNEPTFCKACDHVEPQSRKKAPYYWLCMEHKRLEGQGFVDPDLWANGDPFLRCKDVNGGMCRLFKPIRQADADVIDDEIPH